MTELLLVSFFQSITKEKKTLMKTENLKNYMENLLKTMQLNLNMRYLLTKKFLVSLLFWDLLEPFQKWMRLP
jgi:hypothetical protein